MSSIDERIVAMKFDNKQFESGVKTTMSTLDGLKKGLNFDSAKKGLGDLADAGKKFTLSGMSAGLDGLSAKFVALSTVGITALSNLTTKAMDAGLQMAKSLTIDPIKAGFDEYELKMGSIQTILANTAKQGTSLEQVTAALDELNAYADQTIYNFGDMTKNIGLFTNAGLGVEEATSLIKGFSNEAAASGTSSEGAAGAAYQLSQALSAGTIRLMDWRSLTNVGMGNKNMQNGIIEIAQAMGAFDGSAASAQSAAQDFNGSLEHGWLSAEVMSNYLKIMAGDMTAAEQAALGLSDAQIKGFQQQQQNAEEAATKVRTFTGLIGTLREAVGSGWSATFDIILGDFNEATELFTGASDALGGIIGASTEARNKMLQGWADGGGRTAVIQAMANAFKALMSVITPIGDAFKQIFPSDGGASLIAISKGLESLTEALILSEDSMKNLKNTFAGVFAIFSIVGTVIKAVVGAVAGLLTPLLGNLDLAGGGLLVFTGNIGEWLVALDEAMKKSGWFADTFNKVATAIKPVTDAFGVALAKVKGWSTSLFDSGLPGAIEKVRGALSSFNDAIQAFVDGPIADIQASMAGPMQSIRDFATAAGEAIRGFVGSIKLLGGEASVKSTESLEKGMGGLKKIGEQLAVVWDRVVAAYEWVKKVATEAGQAIGGGLSSIADGIKDALAKIDPNLAAGSLTIGIFAGVIVMIKKFITGPLAEIAEGGFKAKIMELFDGVGGSLQAWQTNLKADALLKIAAAILVLAGAMFVLAMIDPERLLPAAAVMTAMLLEMLGAMAILDKMTNSPGFLKIPILSLGLLLLGGALILFAIAAQKFGALDWEDFAKGMLGITGVLAASKIGSTAKVDAAAMFLMALAIKTLSSAVEQLAKLSWEQLAKGSASIASLLGMLALLGQIKFNGAQLLQAAAAMIVLSIGLTAMVGVITLMAGISWGTFLDGLAKVAISLTAIGLAMQTMPKDLLKTAAGLLVVSIALTAISGVMAIFAGFNVEEMVKSLVMLAGSLLIIGVAVNAMTGALAGAAALLIVAGALAILAPTLLLLGNMELSAIGIALLAIAGVFLVLGLAAAALTPVIPSMIALGVAIGLLGAGAFLAGAGLALMGLGFTAIAAAGALAVPVILALVLGLIKMIPTLVQALGEALVLIAQAIVKAAPELGKALEAILIALLDAIDEVAPRLLDTVFNLLKKLIDLLAEHIPYFVEKGAEMLEGILTGIANNIEGIVTAALNIIENFIQGIADNIGGVIEAGTDLIVNFIDGIANNIGEVIEAGTNLIIKFLEGISEATNKLTDAAFDIVIDFVNELASTIETKMPELREAGGRLATAIVDGMTGGLWSGASKVTEAAKSIGSNALAGAKRILGIHSPSREFKKVGQYVTEGFVQGITGSKSDMSKAYNNMKSFLQGAIKATDMDVKAATANLAKLTKARVKDTAAIDKAKAAVAEARLENTRAKAAYAELNGVMKKRLVTLQKLADKEAALTEKIRVAQEEYRGQTEEEYAKSVKDQYNTIADIPEDQSLETYLKNMTDQIEKTVEFSDKLQTLRDLGLNDALYEDLLEKGPSSLPFLDDILEAGADGVRDMNALNRDMREVAGELGKDVSYELYQAGIDTADGLVAGLQAQRDNIRKEMDYIAGSMVDAIKKKLGIKSPSREFAKVGGWSVKGLISGLKSSAGDAARAAKDVGNDTLDALKSTLSAAAKAVPDALTLEPTIRPVLDLSGVERDSRLIDGILNPNALNTTDSYSRAATIANESQVIKEQNGVDLASVTNVQFVQNNTSPKALSPTEVYRQTNNQLSVLKGGLPK